MTGPRVLVTRALEDSRELCQRLQERGLSPVTLPLLAFESLFLASELEAELRGVRPSLILVSSGQALPALFAVSSTVQTLGAKLAIVGQKSALRAEEAGLLVEHCAESAIDLLDRIAEAGTPAGPIYWLRGDRALPVLGDGLRDLGAQVTERVTYRTCLRRPADAERDQALHDLVAACFTSPTTVAAFLAMAGATWVGAHQVRLITVALGPTTKDALFRAGFRRIRTAESPTTTALADAAARAVRDLA